MGKDEPGTAVRVIKVTVTPEQQELIKAEAGLSGMSSATWLRSLAMGEIRKRRQQEYQEATRKPR